MLAPLRYLELKCVVKYSRFLFQKEWFEGYQLASAMNFKFPQFKRLALNTVVPNASRDGIHLMELLLSWNPIRRPSAQSALRYALHDIIVK